jgi:hypothetical protein
MDVSSGGLGFTYNLAPIVDAERGGIAAAKRS